MALTERRSAVANLLSVLAFAILCIGMVVGLVLWERHTVHDPVHDEEVLRRLEESLGYREPRR